MITSRFSYATTRVGFGSPFATGGTGSSALQRLKSQRAAMASHAAAAQANLASSASSLTGAQQNRISGLGTLAAQAGLARIQAEAKAKSIAMTAQIDQAQQALDAARAAGGFSSGSTVDTLA